MKISDINIENFEEKALEIQKKLEETQSLYNANVTICDVKSQIEELKTRNKDLPLYGVCIGIKDNINTKGIRTTASSRILDNYIPIYDATIIKKLKEAGAIIVSKTSMDELGMGGTNLNAYTGRTYNPYDVTRITGGSSGGSATLVAADIVPVTLGTDTGDSIRKPASYCNLVGLKPTYGRISRFGVIPYASSLDHVGFFTNTLADSALILSLTAGRDDLDATSLFDEVIDYTKITGNVQGKKIAILQNVQDCIDNELMINQFDNLVHYLQSQGAIVEKVYFDDRNLKALLPTYLIIANAEASANHSNLDGIKFGMQEEGNTLEEIMVNTRTKGFSKQVRTRFLMGAYSLDTDNQEFIFKKAQRVRRVIVNELNEKLSGYDALLCLAAPSVAPTPEALSNQEELSSKYLIAENNMLLGNFSGYPSVTIPLGFEGHLPFGVSLLSHAKREDLLFEIGLKIEEFSTKKGE